MRPNAALRAATMIALSGSVCLLAACGMDPPPAAGEQSTPAAESAPAGLALVEHPDMTSATENAAGARCNIETLAGQSLEGVHPRIASGRSVPVLGWYAMAGGAPAVPVDAVPAPVAGSGADASNGAGAAVVAAPAPAPAAAKPVLVIANENGINHWVVTLPAFKERRDVAAAFNDPALGNSGFEAMLDLSALAPGYYSVHLSDATFSPASVCGLGRGFVIQ